jgi:hypothetical protein
VRPQHIDQRLCTGRGSTLGTLATLLSQELAFLLQERADDVAGWLIEHGVEPDELLNELPMVGELNWNDGSDDDFAEQTRATSGL